MKTKQVFSNISDIAHLWANQQQDSARNSAHNFYFNGNTIYSYGGHFPIAKHVELNGNDCILFTEKSYSNTTAKHISVVRQAANHLNLIYCLSPNATHEENFKHWLINAEYVAKNLIKAKKPEKYLNEISYIATKVNKYATFFSLEIPETLQAILNIGNKAQYLSYADKKAEYLKAEEIRKAKEAKKAHAKALKEWLQGKTHRLYVRDNFDYLRVNGENLETTQGVKIPIDIAKRIYSNLVNGTLTTGSKILSYEVASIDKNLQVGCHCFKVDYLHKVGKQIF
jgi:hypothetical protein